MHCIHEIYWCTFTFGFEQVGTNCGLIGKNAVVEIDGNAFWMSANGLFLFDGTVKSLPCTVEDFVYDNLDTTKGQQVAAGINNLYLQKLFGIIQQQDLIIIMRM